MKYTLHLILCLLLSAFCYDGKAQYKPKESFLPSVREARTPASEAGGIDFFRPAPPSPKREVRAVWLTTIMGLDWPKTLATNGANRQEQQQELCRILDQLQACRINTVMLQTRVRGSVIYPSKIEPWDICLTGQYDRDPGYDPLEFAIRETHRRGMELHAWLVSVPAFKVVNSKKMGKKALLRTHPELLKKHGDQYYLDPGLPGSAKYLADICREITQNYDIDGIHFDYIRYPENPETFPDGATFKKYGKGKSKRQWRTDNVTEMVRRAYDAVKALKPWVRVSCSPVGKYSDLSRYSARGWSALGTVYQDAQGWLTDGIMDMLLPMMYFQGDHFYPFAADWKEHDEGRAVAPGLGIYLLSPKEKDWEWGIIQRELCCLRQLGLGGQAYFRSQFLTDDTKGIYDYLQQTFYPYPALLPPMTWQSNALPDTPRLSGRERVNGTNERIEWTEVEGCRYVVYAARQTPVDTDNPANIICVTPDNHFTYNILPAYYRGLHFAITALDRYGNESLPMEP